MPLPGGRAPGRTRVPLALNLAFSEAWEVYRSDVVFDLRRGEIAFPPSLHIVSMSLTGISLGGVLASKNRLRFTRHGYYNQESLIDVMAHILLNDVVAFNT